jgi:hypothetical protein
MCIVLECGLTNAHDGSEDHLIHCFKQRGAIPGGLDVLKEARKSTTNTLNEETDEEEDTINGYVSDDDEVEESFEEIAEEDAEEKEEEDEDDDFSFLYD